MLPIDNLPIKRPLEDNTPIKPNQFYENIIQYLIPDIIKLENVGIPINLEKVQELEKILDSSLENVANKLANNPIIKAYLDKLHISNVKTKRKEILDKNSKTIQDFIVPFNIKNKTHRSYVINTYLEDNNLSMYIMSEWTLKDLKKLNQVISSNFIRNLADNKIELFMNDIINKAMTKLATDKYNIYYKNKVEDKLEKIASIELPTFNPGSTLQKQQLFEMCGIESEKETAKGNPQWDRKELERLQKLLTVMIEEKGE